ncbi:putative rac serine-threonine kinase [Trypanosoma cruzi]|uniref:non-specific serine/threonine protein kinase n=1 Tax=Trypanosoma cruzi TaxID=5693 RepID=A0A2V2V8Q8_TRYCR|nr:putative rac serine-threonine kinase [Trypanosoma cruzi]
MRKSLSSAVSLVDIDVVLTPQTVFSEVKTGVVPLIPITDAIRCLGQNHGSVRDCGSASSIATSPVCSLNNTLQSLGAGTLRGTLGTSLNVPDRMIIPLERLRLFGGHVLGKGAFGEVVRGELNMLCPTVGYGSAMSMASCVTLSPQSFTNSTPGQHISFGEVCSEEDHLPTERSSAGESVGGLRRSNGQYNHYRSRSMEETNLTLPLHCGSFSTDKSARKLLPLTPCVHSRTISRELCGGPSTMHDDVLTDTSNSFQRHTLRHAANRGDTVVSFGPWNEMASYASEEGVILKSVAVKRVDKFRLWRRQKFVKSFQSELNITATLCHPSIVKVYGVAETDAELFLIMDVVEGGTLEDYVKRKGLEDMNIMAPRFLADVVLGLEYLKTVGVAHRDIKPCNMLLTEDHHVVLADFGSACYLHDNAANTFAGSAAYMSPEMVGTGKASATSDLWAMGCILFELFVGRPPFDSENCMLVMRKIKEYQDGHLEYPPYFPEAAKDLVQRLLRRDPMDRLGSDATGGFDALKTHPFFGGIDWKQVLRMSNLIFRCADFSADLQQSILMEDENVVHCSMVLKESRVFFKRTLRRRLLVLTDLPRLFYVDMSTRTVKGTIPIAPDLYVEYDTVEVFRAVTKKRTYFFCDPNKRAYIWAMRVNDVVKRLSTAGNCVDPATRQKKDRGKIFHRRYESR